jgi:glycosyltransferase involved in cell wall biosynthesis
LAIIIPAHRFSLGWLSNLMSNAEELELALSPRFSLQFVLVLDGFTPADKEYCEKALRDKWTLIWLKENQGKGASIRAGLKNAVANLYFFTDDDFPYTLESMKSVVNELVNKADMVFGKRSASYRRKLPLRRRILSSGLLSYNRFFLRLKHPDTQCGLKGFNQVGKDLILKTKSSGFAFDLELAMLCRDSESVDWRAVNVEERKGLDFSEMPVRTLSDEWKSFRKLLSK